MKHFMKLFLILGVLSTLILTACPDEVDDDDDDDDGNANTRTPGIFYLYGDGDDADADSTKADIQEDVHLIEGWALDFWDGTIIATGKESGGANGTTGYWELAGNPESGKAWAAGGWQHPTPGETLVDLSKCDNLSFYARASDGSASTAIFFGVESGNVSWDGISTTITGEWAKYSIVMTAFTDAQSDLDLAKIRTIKVVLTNAGATGDVPNKNNEKVDVDEIHFDGCDS